jgi:metal-responsive CopG/Arc/MetJ family transcriptional regulator
MPRIYLNVWPTLLEKLNAANADRGDVSRSETINLYLSLGMRAHEEALRNYMKEEKDEHQTT